MYLIEHLMHEKKIELMTVTQIKWSSCASPSLLLQVIKKSGWKSYIITHSFAYITTFCILN